MAEKARYWCAVAYPENMIDDWQEEIASVLQMPFAYALHDRDTEKDGVTHRKVHIHVILPFAGPTTLKNVLSVVNRLSKPNSTCCSTAEIVVDMKYMYNYLIHDSADCRKKKKFQYEQSVRVTGNNFDIGTYEQLSVQDKLRITKDLCDIIVNNNILNFTDFYECISENYDSQYFSVMDSKSGLFERLTRGNYQKMMLKKELEECRKTLGREEKHEQNNNSDKR